MKKRLYDEITAENIKSKTTDQAIAKTFRLYKLDQIAEQTKPKARRRPVRIKIDDDGEIDYAPEVHPYEDMDVEGLMNLEDYVAPQTEKQIAKVSSKAPKYEMDPSFCQIPSEPLPSYEDVEPLAIDGPGEEEIDEGDDNGDEGDLRDEANNILDSLDLPNYDDVEMRLAKPEMTATKQRNYLDKVIKDAQKKRNQVIAMK